MDEAVAQQKYAAVSSLAQFGGTARDGVEHRLGIGRRTGDDVENIRCCGLPLQRLARLIEQPCVLDGDGGLIGKALNEFDLGLGKWLLWLARDNEGADTAVFGDNRSVERGQTAGQPYGIPLVAGQVGLVGEIRKMKRSPLCDCQAGRT